MIADHKMLGTDSDGRLGETVRHFGQASRAGWGGETVLLAPAAMTDGFEGRLTGWFNATVLHEGAQKSGVNGQ